MGLIGIVLLVVVVLSAALLVLLVLIQDEHGEGIGGIFGGGSSTPFGSRSGNILTRFTAVLATIFLVCTFALAWLNRSPETGNVIGKARQQQLQTTTSQDWWVETPAPAAQGAQQEGAQQPSAQDAAPAAAPAEGN
ncbi:MAG: preprotein translocase subunit SecG [Spirochaetes bacterium]|nr:preprotein translocase subunit SecG [Spirochaetota bacterium]